MRFAQRTLNKVAGAGSAVAAAMPAQLSRASFSGLRAMSTAKKGDVVLLYR